MTIVSSGLRPRSIPGAHKSNHQAVMAAALPRDLFFFIENSRNRRLALYISTPPDIITK
jgi:hypothetical protein